MPTDNEFRSQSQMGGRVDYVKAGKPTFDLAAAAKIERAKMGGNTPPVQAVSPNQAPAKAPKVPKGQVSDTTQSNPNPPLSTAPHATKTIKQSYQDSTDEGY